MHPKAPRTTTQTALAEYRVQWSHWLTIPVYIGCALAFLSDVSFELFMLFGLFYLPLICTAVFMRDPRAPWWLAGFASALIVIGFFVPVINPETTIAIVNRILSIAALFIMAALVSHARSIQDQLAEQTGRAEAAERLKTEVFTTLSTELRQPLQGLAALAGVMTANCRPDQKAPLERVQEHSQRLATTIDNLIDLMQLEDHQLERRPVNIADVLRQTVDSARPLAESRQIRVVIEDPGLSSQNAQGDCWAIRRIVENLLTNALKFSPPGSVVELGAEMSGQGTVITVRDTGTGIPEPVLSRLTAPELGAEASLSRYVSGLGAGLTLCRGLAREMGAVLSFDSEAGSGTTVTLLLPA